MLDAKRIILAKEESVFGSDPTPTVAANYIEARDVSFNPDGEMLERNLCRTTLSPVAGVVGKRSTEIKFVVDLKGSGTAGTAPRLGDLFEACGYVETVSAGSSVIYSPTSIEGSMKSLTLYYYELGDANAILHKITGARGTMNWKVEAGRIVGLEFTFRGNYNAPSDETNPGTPTRESTKPPIAESGSMTFGGTSTLVIRSLEIAVNNELTLRDDISAAAGINGCKITGRKPSGSFSPEMVNLATKNYFTLWTANTESAIALSIGSVAGNICDITIPKAQVVKVGEESQNGLMYHNVPLNFNESSGNDEFTFKFR